MRYETGRNLIRPMLSIARAGFGVLVLAMALSYPFPLTLDGIPKNPSTSFNAVVVTGHRGGWVEGVRYSSGYKTTFHTRDTSVDSAVKAQMRRYDLARSKWYAVCFWTTLFIWLVLGPLCRRANVRWPDRPEAHMSTPPDSMTEYNRYLGSRRVALLHRRGYLAGGPENYPLTRRLLRWYWDEAAMAGVVALCLLAGVSLFLYTHPPSDTRAGAGLKDLYGIVKSIR